MARKKVTKVLWNLIFTIILMHSSIELSAEEDLELVVQLGHSATTNSVCFSPDNKYAVSGGKDSILVLWDVLTAKKIRSFSGHVGDINSVSFSPGMKKVLSGSEDGTVKLWDIDTGSELLTFEGHSGFVKSVCFSSDGRFVLSGGGDTQLEGELKLWDASSGKEILHNFRV